MTRKPKWQQQVEERIERVVGAIATTSADASTRPSSTETREPAFYWSGRPVYRCRVCDDKYERVENLDSVLKHEAEQHGGSMRPSAILGADGKPMSVEEE